MPRGGHNIKSVESHKARGNIRPSRHDNRLELSAKVLESAPNPPQHFDERHRKLWETCCKEVYDLGVLTNPDIHLIEVFVCNFFLWRDSVASVQKDGYLISVDDGKFSKQIPNPAIRIMSESSKVVNQIADKLGFSPRARMGIKTQEKPPEDPFASFLN